MYFLVDLQKMTKIQQLIIYLSQFVMLHQRVFDNCSHTVIINADDLGITQSIDKGIVQLLLQKRLSSITAIVNQSNSQNAAKMILKVRQQNAQIFQKVSIGLHFNLTRGQPLSQLMKKAKIVEKGKFQKVLVDEFLKQQGYEQQIADQFRKQVKKFISIFKRRPSHVDGHNHIHIYPTVAKAISRIMPQFGIYRIRMPAAKDLISFGQILKSNIEKVRKVYEAKHIIWPDIYLGTQDSGNLKAQKIKQQIEKNSKKKTIQLMCHPGYPNIQGQGWTSKNDRLMQKKQLQSQQFVQFSQQIGGYSSFLDLQVKKSQKNTLRLLIYSKLEIGTGNYTTTLRYKAIFQRMGYQVYTWSVQSEIQPQIQAEDLQKFLINFGISLILGINVSRSAKIIHQATHSSKKIRMQVPYILVIAGTDANYTFQTREKYEDLSQCLRWSQCIVSLSNDMTKITQNVLQELNIQKNIYTIVQSSLLGQLKPNQKANELRCEQNSNDLAQGKKYILFPTSFRRIKCVQHVFRQLNELIQKYNIQVYVLGPIIQKEYYEQVRQKFNNIKYLGTLSQAQYIKRLIGAFAVINCSQTEGMSCSILEALEFGIPVVARSNAGNKQLISHNYNGLIYESSADFFFNIQSLIHNSNFRETIIHNAKKMFKENYSLAVQEKKLACMIEKQIKSKIMELNLNNECIRIFNQSYVHNTSQVNNRLYRQISSHINEEVRILDFGCGTSIFSLLFILNANKVSKIKLYLLDIDDKILGNALYNCRQSSLWQRLQVIAIIQQNFLQKCGKDMSFDVILFNPPQTPFRNPSSRLDKNGGTNGIKFYQCMLNYFSQSKNKNLFMLHSYLAWPQRIKYLLSYYKLRCVWQSEKGFHYIMKEDYDKMEDNLSDFILKHWNEGKADISFDNNCFCVPAEIKLIIKDDDT